MAGALDLVHAEARKRRAPREATEAVRPQAKQAVPPPENKMVPPETAVPENKRPVEEDDALVSTHPVLAGVHFASVRARDAAEAAGMAAADLRASTPRGVTTRDVRQGQTRRNARQAQASR